MDIERITRILLWSAGFNLGILTAWFLMFACARDWVYRLHSRWFKLPPERFDSIHYQLMGVYKLLVLVFNIVPLLAIWITS
ncbi:MAG: DUF6868 family protein [Elusimicrobiota bacterium]